MQFFAARAHFMQDLGNAHAIDDLHAVRGNRERDEAIFLRHPVSFLFQIGQKTPFIDVVGVADLIAARRFFACDLTTTRHFMTPFRDDFANCYALKRMHA